jgi:hypothetical protein
MMKEVAKTHIYTTIKLREFSIAKKISKKFWE